MDHRTFWQASWEMISALALAVMAFLGMSTGGYAQTPVWKPQRVVEFVVPTPASGSLDLSARTLQRLWQDKRIVDAASVIVNKPGGGHAVGYNYLHQHTGDPHFISITSSTLLTSHIVGRSSLTYTDFTPICILFSEYIAFAVRDDSSMKSGKDLMDRLRKDPTSVSLAISSAPGGTHHIALALALKSAGIDIKKIKTVAFNTSTESATALLGGHVGFIAAGTTSVVPHMQAGKLRVIAVSSPERLAGELSSVPTWKEQGYDSVFSNWRAVIAPKGIGPAQVAYWENVFNKVTSVAEFKKDLDKNMWVRNFMGGEESKKFMKARYDELKDVLTDLGMAKK
jgi:putative tricarboxylic transport membrane protein